MTIQRFFAAYMASSSSVESPSLPESRHALGLFELPDDLRVLDLDDPAQLVRLGRARRRW
ncbi:hypothetical protein ACFVKB_40020 [Rhodococcus sp. NPDC127530]|uniref:hypothetical protein n=1 Tax=unclassified Rhodococcus (in: high G+C Gram-positive bacteria) TaxID=192944 RepID=UPI0036269CC5